MPQDEKNESLLIPQDEYLASGCHIGTKLKTIHSEQWIYRITSYGLYVIDLMQTDARIRIAAKFLASFEPERIIYFLQSVFFRSFFCFLLTFALTQR